MKKYLLSLGTLLAAFLVFSISARSAPRPGPKDVKEWTFLIFLNGHNNLDSYGLMNMLQMEQLGSTDKINIVVQWASLKHKDTQRILVQKSTNPKVVTSPIVESLAPVDMGDVKELEKFLEWGAKNYPAKHYFVNVWNHGNGWYIYNRPGAKSRGMKPTDISYDDRTGHFITTEQLGQAMSFFSRVIGHKVDIFGSDACLMAMAEVAGEMMKSVNYFVGSEDLEPGEGWPYSTFLAKWNAMPNSHPKEVAKLLTKEYLAAYSGGMYGRQEVTLSALDLNEMAAFNKAMSGLVSEMMKMTPAEMQKTLAAAKAAQTFYHSDYKDLGDFLARIDRQLPMASQRRMIASVGVSF
jgi:hypothetical protein